jgi:NADPH:quinone reductase-like Zn-dependent oxidoreductase
MKAAVLASSTSVPEFGEFDEPPVTEGRELVSLVAAGIHPVTRSIATGSHYGSSHAWPLVPGIDAVARTADGALVYTGFPEAPYGTFAERIAVPAGIRMELPGGADPVQVAGGLNPGLSSWMPLVTRSGEVDSLGTVLILGVTGMAGPLAVQNALALGATRVVGVGRNPVSLDRAAEHGAVTVAFSDEAETDASAIASALDGDAPTLVLDFVWGAPAEATFSALTRSGLDEDSADIAYIEIGAMAGADAAVPASLLRSRRIRISGSGAGSASMPELVRQIPAYMELIADGRVEVPTLTYPLSRVSDAWTNTTSASRIVLVAD